ncbi:MAG: MerR family transcriptional regulator [Clostridium sp.]|nr:MerR family transcriptional regulator [Clostridium sp.]MCM1399081.1 MerR family transcriptional regulator [Clostridium sp.]MCM1459473.1 MerR family transcriptional regulator [Bacteroides sp.]
MKIKEVEQLTGLTAKSIRYYESKGLLEVGREEENSYRTYTEENVKELKKIRLLRFLDFSIEQISELQHADEKSIKEILLNKAEELDNSSRDLNIKKELLRTLGEDGITNATVVEEYNSVFDKYGEEWQDGLIENLKDFMVPSLTEVIACTFIWLGPVLWLFYNIHMQKWHGLAANAVLALLFTVFITSEWIRYFRTRKYQPKRMKKKNRENLYLFPGAIVGGILCLALIIFVYVIEEILFAPEEWLFYQMKPFAEWWLVLWVGIPIFVIALWVMEKVFHKKQDKEQETDGDEKTKTHSFRKYGWIFALLWLLVVYVCISNVTFVTQDEIIVHSPLCPQGKSYNYTDVEKAEAFFGTSVFTFPWQDYKRSGSFSYTIYIDGKRIIFSQAQVNGDITRYDDTYLELEEFDEALMQCGIAKESGEKGYEDCGFDQVYVDRFLRIINNR